MPIKHRPHIYITVYGGVIQEVRSTHARVDITVIDCDGQDGDSEAERLAAHRISNNKDLKTLYP